MTEREREQIAAQVSTEFLSFQVEKCLYSKFFLIVGTTEEIRYCSQRPEKCDII